jgi:hypothetical protein
MENNRKYFIVPLEYAEELDLFTNEQLGELFRALLHYSAYGTDSDSNSFPIKLMYRILKKGIDQNFENYEEVKNKRRDAANKRWKKENENDTNECKAMQSNANECKAMQSNANDTNTNTKTNTKTNTNNSSSAKLSDKAFEDEFQEVWNIYPRKEGRKNALKAYIKARKNGTSKETILSGLNAYIGKIKAERTETQYIKHGSSWFSQECWLDDYSAKKDFTETSSDDYYDESIWGKMI